MDVQKLQGKLITRSKSKTSVGDRELVNFLENLSKDETGAPVKWKFNKSGIKFAKGIGKKIADASKPSSAVYVDSTIKLAQSVLRKHVKKQISDHSMKYKKQLKLKKAEESSVAENLPIKRKRGRPKKIVKEGNELQKCQSQENESSGPVSDQQPVERKRGRPKKIIKSTVVMNEKHDSKNWTQLSKKVFQQSLPGLVARKALQSKIRGSSEERGDSDRIDSEMETESIDSNVSGCSELKRQKKRNVHGIKLGPKKLLRSQDSLITRHAKDVGSAVIKANRKPRKRTLSGEFELLDENSLRKKMKLNEDSGETVVRTETDINSEKKRCPSSKTSMIGQTIENDTNVNIPSDKNSHNSSSVVDTQGTDSESVSEDNVQTFSVKSMKHPSLLRKPEIRNINLKKSNEEDFKSTSTKLDSKNSEIIKRKPGRPSNKLKNLSTSENVQQQQHEKTCDLKTPFTFLQQKPNISMEQKVDKPVRGLQIVGPGGMKFTKKVKCDSDVSPFSPTVSKIDLDNSSLVTPTLIEKSHEPSAKTEMTDIVIIEKSLLIEKNENEIKTQDVTVHQQPNLTLVNETEHPKSDVKEDEVKEEISAASASQATDEEAIAIENKNSKVVESSDGSVSGKTNVVTECDTNEQEKLKDNQSSESGASNEELSTQNVLANAKEPTETCHSVLSTSKEEETAATDVNEESTKTEIEASENVEKEQCENSVVDENLKINVEQMVTNVQSTCTSMDDVDKSEEIIKENIDSDEKKNERQSHSEVNNSLSSDNNSEFVENQDKGPPENMPKNEEDLISAKTCPEEPLQHEDGGSSSKQELNLTTVSPSEMQNEVSDDCSAASHLENNPVTSISVPKDDMDSNKNSKLMEVSDCISDNILDCKEDEVSKVHERIPEITCTSEKEISDLAIGPTNNEKMNSEGKETAYIPGEEKAEQSVPQEIINQVQKTVSNKTKTEDNTVSGQSFTPISDEDNGSSTSELNASILDSSSESHQEKSPEKTVPEKRQIQLRQKASRSPLEIIAMRQSLEERQYLLEQSQKALKREEKQKKMKEKHKKLVDEDKDKEKEVEKDVSKELTEEIVKESAVEEYEQNQIEDALSLCKPCSVVLIDFVKYLKTTKTSYSVESGSVLEEWETVEENDSAVSPRDSSEPTTSDQESSTKDRLDAEVEKETSSQKCDDDVKESTNVLEKVQGEIKPVKRKRKASARKQVRSVTYSAQLTAEIVSNPMLLFTDETQTTVPPLRLKIKQNIIAKPRIHKQKRGLKFTTKKQHKARKGMSPVKSNPPPAVIEAAIAASEPESKKQRLNEVSKKGFVGSFVQFIQDQEESTAQKRTHYESTCRQKDKPIHQGFGPPSGELVFPRFKCSYKPCSFVALSRSVIESHIYVHLKNIPFKCCYCNSVFNTRNGASMHMRSMHSNLEAKIEPASSVNEKLYYEEITEDGKSQTSHSTPSDMLDKSGAVNNTQEPLVIKVVLPQSDNGCYYCVYCDFSAANQQDILDHIQNSHDHAAQYACSVCNKVVQGSKDEMASHFAEAHPNQQLVYKYLPDLFGNKNNPNNGNPDKGNIFDRMNDLFPGSDNGNKKAAFPQKTSAEADSTTAETDDNNMKEDTEKSSATPESQSVNKSNKEMTEAGQGVENTQQFTNHLENTGRPATEGPSIQNDDMGLKIVDVVSLRDQLPEEWFPNQESDQSKTHQTVPNPVGKPQVPSSECHQPVSIIDTVRTGGRLQQRPSVATAQPSVPVMSQNKDSKISNGNFGTTYKCEKCNVHAPVLSAMVEHLRVTHKDIARLFLCPYCRQYEGASEPEIHRHIKQFHHSPNQKSPPVALSSAAKKHLRTIQVPAGDARKVNDKFVIERDIYKCLKCQKHMPSLDYIYDHLEKTHNEVFVYVCPYCKIFKAKKEEVVFHHIRSDHNKNATDIMLSLAIEENLFTRIQSLVKDKQKSTQKISQNALQTVSQQRNSNTKPAEEDVIVVAESRPQAIISQINASRQVPNMAAQMPNLRPAVPLAVNQQPVRMPFQSMDKPNPYTFQPRVSNSPMNSQSKSSLRKSRPHHIPQQNPFTQRNITDVKEMEKNPAAFQHMVSRTSVHSPSVPPALMRGPPPLLKVSNDGPNQTQEVKQYQVQQQSRYLGPQNKNNVYTAANQLESFATTANMHSSQGALHTMANTMSGITRPNRPVLKVPSVTSQFNRQQEAINTNIRNLTPKQPQTNSPMFTNRSRPDGTAPLDLSRSVSEKPISVVGQQQSFDDELPPDAFQIFNLRPAGMRMPVQRSPLPIRNMNRQQYQAQIRQPPVQQMGTMPTNFRPRFPNNYSGQMARQPPPYNAIPTQRINSPLTSNNIVNQNVRLSAVALQSAAAQSPSPIPGDLQKGAQNLAVDNQRVFKCPYCPNIVPLSMGEVAPHTEKFHPGHSIVFMKIDKLT